MLASKKALISAWAAFAIASLSMAQINPDDPPLVGCTGCAAGKCDSLDPKTLYTTFSAPEKTKFNFHYRTSDPNKHLEVEIHEAVEQKSGTQSFNSSPGSGLHTQVILKAPLEQGCIVVGFKSSQKQAEEYAVLEQAYPSQWSCGKKLDMDWNTVTQVRAWKVADGLCPHGLQDDSS